MGVDSKVFVVADKSQALAIGQAVFEAIEKWQRELLDKNAHAHGLTRLQFLFNENENKKPNGSPMWTNGARIHASSFECFQIDFTVEGDHRTLWYFTDCECDTDYITKEHTFLFSIGHWGRHARIMHEVIKALTPFGPVYYDHNDCDEHDYVLQN